MNPLLQKSREWRAAADDIFLRNCVLEKLSSLAKVKVHGSYDLDVMVHPELDVLIGLPELTSVRVFEVGRVLAETLRPEEMLYYDSFLHPVPWGMRDYFL